MHCGFPGHKSTVKLPVFLLYIFFKKHLSDVLIQSPRFAFKSHKSTEKFFSYMVTFLHRFSVSGNLKFINTADSFAHVSLEGNLYAVLTSHPVRP